MNCLHCTELVRTLRFTQSKYVDARGAPFFVVSTEVAASRQVDMERAKSDLYEHQAGCSFSGDLVPSTQAPRCT
jgi:hypothetical protein